jgi:hypothetical protein
MACFVELTLIEINNMERDRPNRRPIVVKLDRVCLIARVAEDVMISVENRAQ